MLGLPQDGARVRVWPMPGRKVERDAPPLIDAPGGAAWLPRYLPKNGEVVMWDTFRHNQLLAGDILLHPPPCGDSQLNQKHDHGDDGQEECKHCGRTVKEAQQYDVNFAKGVEEHKAALKLPKDHPQGIPEHPLEKHNRLLAEKAKAREERLKAEAEAAKAAPAPGSPSPTAESAPSPSPSQK